MLVLGMDTATDRVSVAIGRDGRVIGSVQLAGGRRHAEQLTPSIEMLTRELDIELSELAAVAVGVGPGLFTGLRVGVTTAKVLAQALQVPVVPVSSLDLVAYPLRWSSRRIVVVLDARRREVFHASYRSVPGGVARITDPAVGTPAELVADLAASGDEVLLAGDGLAVFPDEFASLGRSQQAGAEHAAPSVAALVELATARVAREEFVAPRDVRAVYLRESDAEILWADARRAVTPSAPSAPPAAGEVA